MSIRKAKAEWDGSLKAGKGRFQADSGVFQGNFTYTTRFEEEPGTNPEELIGAALAGCFSMALSADMERAGTVPEKVSTSADVHFGQMDGKPRITRIHLTTRVRAPGMNNEQFQQVASGTKENCPISAALRAVEITLDAKLE
jgi:osmotically inducible protein OsmC